ncbi:MAG: 50S ribosomal protein L32 [Candidatus Margulisiibacteriota bacterium]
MPVPKKRHSNARSGNRRAKNYQLTAKGVGSCQACGSPTIPHHACSSCGSYRGKHAVKIKTKKDKQGKKDKK